MRNRIAFLLTIGLLGLACSSGPATSGAPATTGVPPVTSAPATTAALSAAPTVPPVASIPATPAAPTETPASATAPPASPAAGGTTFTLVLADGPREGTWVVTEPAGAVANCKYLPDLERWIATWLGPPPLAFIDVRGDASDPSLLFKFTDEPDELNFRPSGDVTFEADDRGDTATLTWSSETNDGTYFDSSGNNTGSVDMGRADLTIECGSIFRYT
jgi:hypothetical protein